MTQQSYRSNNQDTDFISIRRQSNTSTSELPEFNWLNFPRQIQLIRTQNQTQLVQSSTTLPRFQTDKSQSKTHLDTFLNDNSQDLQQLLNSKLSELKIINRNKKLVLNGTSINPSPTNKFIQQPITTYNHNNKAHLQQYRSSNNSPFVVPKKQSNSPIHSEQKMYQSASELNQSILKTASATKSIAENTSIFAGRSSELQHLQLARSTSSSQVDFHRRKIEKILDHLTQSMQESELNLMLKYKELQNDHTCNIKEHPQLIELIKSEQDLYISTLESSLQYLPQHTKLFMTILKNQLRQVSMKTQKVLVNASEIISQSIAQNESLKQQLQQYVSKEFNLKKQDEYLEKIVNHHFTTSSLQTVQKGINKETIAAVQEFLNSPQLVTNDKLLEMKYIYSADSGLKDYLQDMLYLNELEMEKCHVFNRIDHEKHHIDANLNFANDFCQNIKLRCRDVQHGTAIRMLTRLNPAKHIMDKEIQCGSGEIDRTMQKNVIVRDQIIANLKEVLKKRLEQIESLKDQIELAAQVHNKLEAKYKKQLEMEENIENRERQVEQQIAVYQSLLARSDSREEKLQDKIKQYKSELENFKLDLYDKNQDINNLNLKLRDFENQQKIRDQILQQLKQQLSTYEQEKKVENKSNSDSEMSFSASPQKNAEVTSPKKTTQVLSGSPLKIVASPTKQTQNDKVKHQESQKNASHLKTQISQSQLKQPIPQQSVQTQQKQPIPQQQFQTQQTTIQAVNQIQEEKQIQTILIQNPEQEKKIEVEVSQQTSNPAEVKTQPRRDSQINDSYQSPSKSKVKDLNTDLKEFVKQPKSPVKSPPKQVIKQSKIQKIQTQKKPQKQKVSPEQVKPNQKQLIVSEEIGPWDSDRKKIILEQDNSETSCDKCIQACITDRNLNEIECQTDVQLFAKYIISLFQMLETSIESGIVEKDQLQKQSYQGAQIGFSQDMYVKLMQKNLNEIRNCFQKLRSIRSFNGENFFASICGNFLAKCYVPFDYQPTLFLKVEDALGQRIHYQRSIGGAPFN